MDEHDTFPQRVWQIVASIPEGCVTTYGEVARLAGSPRAARQVGGVLRRLPEEARYRGTGSSIAMAPFPSPGQTCSASVRHYSQKGCRCPGQDRLICRSIAGSTDALSRQHGEGEGKLHLCWGVGRVG